MVAIFCENTSFDAIASVSTEPDHQLGRDFRANSVFDFDFVEDGLKDFALQAASNICTNAQSILESALAIGKKLAEAQERLTRKEFKKFRERLLISATDAKKCLQLYEVFGGWAIEKILVIGSATNIFVLCKEVYDEVRLRLRACATITKDGVRQLVKEVRDRLRAERQQKSREPQATGWEQDPSGGGRHYAVNLYNEDVAMKVERLAQERQMLPHRIIADAIVAYEEPAENTNSDYQELGQQIEEMRRTHQQELAAVVSEVREKHIEMQRQLLERDRQLKERECRILELEAELQQKNQLLQELPRKTEQSFAQPEQYSKTTESKNDSCQSEQIPFSSWLEVAEEFGSTTETLVRTANNWTIEQKYQLVNLLTGHLQDNPGSLDTELKWVPPTLILKALQELSFTVKILSGENNLVDEPVVEEVFGCKLASLEYPNTKHEHWIFRDRNDKIYSVFGRDWFGIEGF